MATEAIEAAGAESADLTAVHGIGPKVAEKLAAIDVGSLDILASLDDARVKEIDAQLNLRGKMIHGRWHKQAANLLSRQVQQDDTGMEFQEQSPEWMEGDLRPDKDEIIRELMARLSVLEQNDSSEENVKANGADMRMRLNRNQDYHQVFGRHEDVDAAEWMQIRDGREVYFTKDFIEIREGETPNDLRGAILEPEHLPEKVEDFHPINYLDGKQDYDFEFVRDAVNRRFGRKVKSEKQAKEVLHVLLRSNH